MAGHMPPLAQAVTELTVSGSWPEQGEGGRF